MTHSCDPKLLIADELATARDVSVQAQTLGMLRELRRASGAAIIFISHDLGVVAELCDPVAVMGPGQIVEFAANQAHYDTPLYPYTKALRAEAPRVDPGTGVARIGIPGDVPSPITPPSGCRFHTRCPYVIDVCWTTAPSLGDAADGHLVACHLYPVPGAHPSDGRPLVPAAS